MLISKDSLDPDVFKMIEDSRFDMSWEGVILPEFKLPYFKNLSLFVSHERAQEVPIYPPQKDVFNALLLTPFDKVRVVILGQDPYHGMGQAHGLCFSVPHGIEPPPSLKNIFKELKNDLDVDMTGSGNLTSWAEQGVLLLNTTLTVSEGLPLSHHRKGWERFTDAIIKALACRNNPVIFVLWGKSAQTKCEHVLNAIHDGGSHVILKAPHPSPLSAYHGFFGSQPFSKINQILQLRGDKVVDWKV